MYVKNGMGAIANPGFVRPGTRVLRLPINIRRGVGQLDPAAIAKLVNGAVPPAGTCTNGGAWNQNLGVCCAPTGTPPMQDPCSILNNPAFIAQQNAQIAQDIATAGPIEAPTLQALTSVPINIGNDAVYCQSNPGATFVDSEGVRITCPAGSHSDVTTGGQPMSTLSVTQLASQLNSQYGAASPVNPGNAKAITVPVAQTSAPSFSSTPATAAPIPSTVTNGGTNAAANSSSSSTSGTDLVSQVETSLGGSVTLAGYSIPIWALVGGGLAALWFFGGKR